LVYYIIYYYLLHNYKPFKFLPLGGVCFWNRKQTFWRPHYLWIRRVDSIEALDFFSRGTGPL